MSAASTVVQSPVLGNEAVQHETCEIFRVLGMQETNGMRIAPPRLEVDPVRLDRIGFDFYTGHVGRELGHAARHVIVCGNENETLEPVSLHPTRRFGGILAGVFRGKIEISTAVEFRPAVSNLLDLRLGDGWMHASDKQPLGSAVL